MLSLEMFRRFHGGPGIKKPPCNARDTGLICGLGRCHILEQQSLCSTTTEPVLWSPGTTTTEPAGHNYLSPCTLEPVLTAREATAMRSLRTTARGKTKNPCSNESLAQPKKEFF